MKNINWKILTDSIEYFKTFGFKYEELEWIVPKNITKITCLEGAGAFSTPIGDIIGSAEQAFLNNYESLNGQYMSLTPCFRDEPVNYLHSKHFMKLELFDNRSVTYDRLLEVVDICKNNFEKYLNHCKVIETEEGFDIEYNSIELGSYGIRAYQNYEWLYATGVAEPRLSTAIKNKEKYGL